MSTRHRKYTEDRYIPSGREVLAIEVCIFAVAILALLMRLS
jgi:hypothetical protein